MLEAILLSLLDSLLHKLCSSTMSAGSQWLKGIDGDVDWLRDELQTIHSFLQSIDEASNTAVDNSLSMLVEQIRDVVYDSEATLDKFDFLTARGRVSPSAFLAFHFNSSVKIGSLVRGIRSRLENISRRRLNYTLEIPFNANGTRWGDGDWLNGLASSPLVPHGEMVGVENDFKELLERVLTGEPEIGVISLVGMGGVGKTTLIKRVYTHKDVVRQFDRCMWIYVSQSIELHELFAEMVKGLMEFPSSEVDALSTKELQEALLRSLEEKRYLIVFDDVWSTRIWNAMKLVLPSNQFGSRVIITTRNIEVASAVCNDGRICIQQLNPLSPEDSWALFCNKVFGKAGPGCPEELKEIAESIVRKCDGLPLALVTVGGMMLRKQRTQLDWRRVLGNMYRDFSDDNVGVQRALLSSYKDLPYFLKSCFLMFSVLPKDYLITRKRLIRLWMAEGFIHEEKGEVVEDIAEKYLMELINRSMIQISSIGKNGRVKACRIHNLLQHLTISIAEKERYSAVYEDRAMEIHKKAYRISFHKNYCNTIDRGKLQSRSLFTFGIEEELYFSHQLLQSFKSLRILDLEDARLHKLPTVVGDLIHLRYLGLKGTRIKKLPKSLKNLYYLQTLDIRKTNLRELSFKLNHLKQLRHLEMSQDGWSVSVAVGLRCLQMLRVVSGLQATRRAILDLGKLPQLKKLSIEDLRAEDAVYLSSSINKMGSLSSLSIYSEDDTRPLDLSTLTHLSSLQKLHIAACLEKLPKWISGTRNLTKLRLGLSRLHEDPFIVLENLSNLVFLQLYEAYQGKAMRCSMTGFRKLKILILTGLDELEEWNIEEGAMPCIQELWIMSCSMLKTIPSGIEFLAMMQKLTIVSMPDDFVSKISSPSGEDFVRVQQIPTIQVLQ